METWYLFIRPLLADCSLHEESELDLHYNNLWLELQRWLSFCIDFCILIFIFSLGHTGRKEPLQNLWQVSGRGGWKKKNHITNPLLVRFPRGYYWQHWKWRQNLTWETLHEPPKSVRKKAAVWVPANPFPISHTHLHCVPLHVMSTGSAAGSADSALKHNCSSSCPSASFLPSLWKCVLSLVPEISLFPPYLKTPPGAPN